MSSLIPLGLAEGGGRLARLVIVATVSVMTEAELLTGARSPGALDVVLCVGMLYIVVSSSHRIVPIHARRLAMLCLACDVIFITALVDLTGGVASELYPLYYLPILQACIRLRLRDALGAAFLSVAFYSFLGFSTGLATEVSITAGVRVATFAASAVFMAVFFALMMRETREKQEHLDRIELLLQQMGILFEMGRLLSATLDFSTLMKRTANCAVRAVDAAAAGVLLLDPDTGHTSPVAVNRAGRQNAALPALESSWQLAQAAADTRKTLTIPGRAGERELKRRMPEKLRARIKSALAVPFGREDQPLGVLQVVNKRTADAFSTEDVEMLSSIGAQAAIAVENARLFEELNRQVQRLEAARVELAQSEKLSALGGLISGVAHELNNPLTAVLGFAELLLKRPNIEKAEERIKLIHEAALRCKHVVGDLLLFARSGPPRRVPVNINDIVAGALTMQQGELDGSGIEVSLGLDTDLPRVMADGPQIEQVVTNLIRNARQAMATQSPPRSLYLGTRANNGSVQLEVRDSGSGIAPADMKRIFEPFFTTRDPGQGTGLGLSVSYGIVDAHGGSIQAHPAEPQGVSFVVELPAQLEAPAEGIAAKARSDSVASLGVSVLVVDDDEQVRELVREGLEEAGCRVDEAANGRAALERISACDYDALIVDVKMPDMDGRDLYEELRRADGDLAARVVLITGDTVTAETVEFLEMAGTPALAKPFALGELIAAVRSVASQSTAR